MSNLSSGAIQYSMQERDRFLHELQEFLRIPSVSSDPAYDSEVTRAAEWLAERLSALGAADASAVRTKKHPIVFGRLESTVTRSSPVPTILVYGHYDVQRPDPLDEWDTGPFEPTVKGEELFARGAVDDKGPTMAAIAAIESLVKAGELPVNIKFMIEGEEEIGSPSLPGYLAANKELLRSDFSLNGDSGMAAVGIPTISYGLRGSIGARLIVEGPTVDLHSGIYGGVIHNPIHVLAKLIAGMHDDNGLVTLPGFYNDVRSIDEEERQLLAQIPRDEALTLKLSGAPATWGDERYSIVERTGARPTLDVLMIKGGAVKTAIPNRAQADISMRLVPDQMPRRALAQLQEYLELKMPPTVTWKLLEQDGSRPSLVNRDNPWIQAMAEALEVTWGRKPLYDRLGGSIPAVTMLEDELGIDSVLIGVFRPGDNIHAPNEKLHLPSWEKMIETIIHFVGIIGERSS